MQKSSRRPSKVDFARLDAMTESEIERNARLEHAELGLPDPSSSEWLAPENWFRGDKYPKPREIRDALKLSQAQFAKRFGLSIKTIQHWEQSRTVPDRAALILLKTIELYPDEVKRAVDAMRVKPLPDT